MVLNHSRVFVVYGFARASVAWCILLHLAKIICTSIQRLRNTCRRHDDISTKMVQILWKTRLKSCYKKKYYRAGINCIHKNSELSRMNFECLVHIGNLFYLVPKAIYPPVKNFLIQSWGYNRNKQKCKQK